jgi:hypothetical protein
MDGHTEKNKNKPWVAKRSKSGRPFKHRVLALFLVLVMILSSSGMQAVAGQTDTTSDISEEVSVETTQAEVENITNTADDASLSVDTEEDSIAVDTEANSVAVDTEEDSVAVDTEANSVVDTEENSAAVSNQTMKKSTRLSTDTTKADSLAVNTSNDGISVQSNSYVDSDGNFDITNLMTQDSYLMVQVNGTYYTLEELAANGLKVPKGATVFAHLEWDKITGIEAGQKLVYQVPKDMVTGIVAEDRFMFSDNHDTFAGYMSLSSDGLFTVEIDSNYFKTWSKKQQTSTLELDYVTLEFYGTLSANHGETSGNNDNKIIFRGETEAEPKSEVSFEIPFEYKNENSAVKVEKSSTFSPAKQSITYTVKAITPKSNTMTSENVKLIDAFGDTTYLVNESSNATGVYQSVKATLYTNTNNGANLTNGTDISDKFAINRSSNGVLEIGDMEPDSVVVLEYTVKVDDKYFSTSGAPSIINAAQATYNDNVTSGVATSEQACEGMAKITKSADNIETDANGDPYIPYTVKVTAHGQVTNISVKDVFTQNASVITKLADITPSQGSIDEGSDKDLTWNVGTLSDGQTATLTYKAYLDPQAWSKASTTSSGKAIQQTVTIQNKADLYVGNDFLGSATVTKDITKTWVNKVGQKNESTGLLSYTVYVNSDPVAKDITSIYDQLDSTSANAGAKINYPISVKVYDSSNGKTRKLVYDLSLKDSTTGFTASDSGWRLDLTTYDNGKLNNKGYYYVVTYTASGGGAKDVVNGAGINRGPDISYGEGTSIQVKTVSADKYYTYVDYRAGYISWESTMSTDIDAGTVYYDWFDDDKVGDTNNGTYRNGVYPYRYSGYYWYSMDDINAVEIYQGDEVIYSQAQGVNKYGITIEPYDDKNEYNPYARQPVLIPYWTYTVNPDGTYNWTSDDTKYGYIGYIGFKITFGEAIDVEGHDKVTIKYNSSCSWENMYRLGMSDWRTTYTADGNYTSWPWTTNNHAQWKLSSGISSNKIDRGQTISNYTADVVKGSTFNTTTGIITWKIYLNRMGDMIGDATVEDILPAGLKYLDIKLDYNTGDGKTYVGSNFNTSNDNSSYGNIKKDADGNELITVEEQADGTTKLTVLLENLRGFNYNKDDYKDGWYDDGNVVLTVRTRVDDALLMKGGDLSFTNGVTVTNATMAGGKANAYATQNIKMASENILNKTMDNYTSGTVLTFNMDINTNGEDLIYKTDENDGTKLEIMDVMSSKMSLATYRDNYFVVTDGNGNELTEAASDAISSNEYYVTQVESEEGTAYKIIVPDGKALHIQYLVSVDAAVGEKVDISNKAYFVYEGLQAGDTGNKVEQNVQISRARGTSGTSADNPSFKIYKKDQWGNPVAGVTFTLYKVTLNSDGTAGTEIKVKDATTGTDGYAAFDDLDEYGVYCFEETSVPTGYVKSTEKPYFYFTAQSNLNIDGAIGIDYNEKVFEVTNQYSPASLTIPLTKTINGKDQESKDVFGFTLTKTNGDTVYSDEKCTSPVTATVVSIEGSGTVNFDTLYFKEPGEYTFTLSENNLTTAETAKGFAKSDVVYTITANVVNDDEGLHMDSATYTWTDADGKHTDGLSNGDLLKKDTPVFNNTLTQKPVTIKLEAVKQLTGDTRSYGIQEDEFTFAVVEDGEIVAYGTTTGTTTDKVDGVTSTIDFGEITYTQDQLGTHVLTIYEVSGSSLAISYSQTKFFATVVVEPVDGKAELQATVTYSTQNKDLLTADGLPIFINQYTDIPITGIRVDTLPYIVGIAIVACGGTLMFVRRRKKQ